MFQTGSGVSISFEDIPEKLLNFYKTHKEYGEQIDIIIGTDSQNFPEKTKVVTVIAMVCNCHGGIYMYEIKKVDTITNVKQKLQLETGDSLLLAQSLVDILESDSKYNEMYKSCELSIHVDAGNSEHGKTKKLIPELVGWINSCGYNAKVKPDSFAASSIADRISK